jgi:ferredoxin--NADP+ reductase
VTVARVVVGTLVDSPWRARKLGSPTLEWTSARIGAVTSIGRATKPVSIPLRVAVIGAGPAGIHASDILLASGLDVSIDLFERLPAPYGLVRYGVAPDHPWIKQIALALHSVLERGDIRLLCNVDVGTDVTLADLRRYYDAVIVATGAIRDADLAIPGVGLPGSFGAADFVSWYDGHPDVPRDWPLDAEHVAVVGAGNVALDITRVLVRDSDEMLRTDVPANVYRALAANRVTDVHIFARRGPAQAKFSPLELRELGKVPGVEVIVDPVDLALDEDAAAGVVSSADVSTLSNQTQQMVATLREWAQRGRAGAPASRRVHLHFWQRPVAVLGDDRVTGLRTERTTPVDDGSVVGTGTTRDWPVQAVYRAVGYLGSPVLGLPFDDEAGVIRNEEGRVVDTTGERLPGVYATGWIKRGPVGLIGQTKSDARQTIRHLVEDVPGLPRAPERAPDAVMAFLAERGVRPVTWSEWLRLEAHEQALGAAQGRDRVKVVAREEMLAVAREEMLAAAHRDG